jgi:hypothetical protein
MHAGTPRLTAAIALSTAFALILGACARDKAPTETEVATIVQAAMAPTTGVANPERNAYFGNLHVHTGWSFDGMTNGSRTTPKDAYAWAQGREITNSGIGGKIQIGTPLDFYMVSDHAEYMGVFNQMQDPSNPLSKTKIGKGVTDPDPNVRLQTFAMVLRDMSAGKIDPALADTSLARSVWSEIIKAADENYQPGKFTTFAGFEWTSNPDKRNLHRVVVFRDTKTMPETALSALDSDDPESLWKWMNLQRERGSMLLAIPHNGNASDGRMFELVKFDGQPIDAAYNATRAANEPLYEITQIKGTSETRPSLSPTDEFANFEQWDYTLSADAERPTKHDGSFIRKALLDGLSQEQAGQGNPFKYGFIGDSDTHNAAGSVEEFNYTGKFAFENDATARLKGLEGQPPAQHKQVLEFSSGGLAGVWAEENTREAIFDAMKRKETFGTSGPMIKLRFFASWELGNDAMSQPDFVKRAYAGGVAMGGDLKPGGKEGAAPTFFVMALKDPKSGNLDRIQIVKGWLDEQGAQHESIHDVTWSGDRKPGADGKLPAVGDTVDAAKGTYTNAIGAGQLAGTWTDPDFKAGQRAFYYARVLEIPTPRWSTIDAANLGMAVPEGLPISIQERAWSSPIWYAPN